jgi:hypothetical protein
MSYYLNLHDVQQRCPFCAAARPLVLHATAVARNAHAHAAPRWVWLREAPTMDGGPVGVPHRVFFPFSLRDGDQDMLEVSRHAEGIHLRRPAHLDPRVPPLAVAARSEDRFVEIAARVVLPSAAARHGFRVRGQGTEGRDVCFAFQGELP